MAKLQIVADNDFEKKVINVKGLVLVMFFATWCGPCGMTMPHIKATAKEHNGDVEFFKLDVDENPLAVGKYDVSSLPTIILFQDGEFYDVKTGRKGKDEFEEMINVTA